MAKDYWGTGPGTLTPRAPDPDTARRAMTGDAAEKIGARAPITPAPGTDEAAGSAHAEPTAADRGAPSTQARFIPDFPSRPTARSTRAAAPVVADAPVRERRRIEAPTRGDPREAAPIDAPSRFRLPESVRSISFGRKLWFGLSFVAPVVIGFIYLFLIAPDLYITEYRFSVRVPVGQQGGMASSGASLSALFGGNPTPGADLLDNYTVADYVSSAQAARDLNAKISLGQMYNKPADPFSRVGDQPTAEKLARYWQSMVYSSYDVASGLAVVRVSAYTAQDSYAIATSLVALSSDLVNTIGTNSQQDSVRFAQQQLDRANAEVAKLRGELADLRLRNNIVDPSQDLLKGKVDLVTTLTMRRAQLQAQLAALTQRLGNGSAPQLTQLRQQIEGLNGQIASASGIRGRAGGGPNLAVTVGRFEDLQAELKNALAMQAAANAAVGNMHASADAQRLYITTYVKPELPQSPQGPNRWLDMLIVTMIAAMAWVVGRLIGNSIMEHA